MDENIKKPTEIPTDQLSHYLYQKSIEQAACEKEFMVYDKNREALLESITEDFMDATGDAYTRAKAHARNAPKYVKYIDDMAESKSKLIVSRGKFQSVDAEIKLRINQSYHDRTQLGAGKIDT